ncbi:iron-sulfur cluster assembly protein [Bacillus sp. FJAT-50079]|uniref:iron-sulfur cluster assembly protein n=1 Tax=Bacillus sp. FJAT-50079 TaxID=2833577 RepID=UPI001BCA2AF5|nr:iron-sulfur cluster assembly protein [Bacillus sp. FJAT-50079]MBS4210456.1 iron-sulfur cluster assembly protein [Bacillus sp. FJAT-50079]
MNKEKQVYERLDKVYDPELDQPLTELGFIDRTIIKDDQVEVIFRLPTYWCSPNFAYIMAEDIKKYVSELHWVNQVTVNLIDHCASDEINQGVTDGKRFSESFGGEAGGDLEEVRKTFQIKAFYARQEKMIKHLLSENMPKERIITLSFDELNGMGLSKEGQQLRERYVEKKTQLNQSTYAFPTPEGEALNRDEFEDYVRNLKRTRLSMEFNGHYCRGLLEARYKLPSNEDKLVKN